MRAVIVAAALLIGTAAYAQDNSGSGGMQGTSAGAGGQTSEPSNAAPRRDARGIPVISAPATAPSGWNQPPGTPGAAPASQPAGTQGSAGSLPPCTRTVTDNCVQTYQRNRNDAGDTAAAAGTSDNTTAAADTDEGTGKARHHRSHGHHSARKHRH